MDYTKEKSIRKWLDKYEVQNYTLIEDKEHGFILDVEGDVTLDFKKLEEIKIQFNVVKGSFDCQGNILTDLNFSPIEVGGNFNCSYNQLNSLEFLPREIGGGTLIISNDDITELNLENLPEIFIGEVSLNDNPLDNNDIENNKIYQISELSSILEKKQLEKKLNSSINKNIHKI